MKDRKSLPGSNAGRSLLVGAAAWALAFALVGCGTGNPSSRPVSFATYTALGDSITEGCCTDDSRPYVTILAADLSLPVSNLGLSGQTVFDQATKAYAQIVPVDAATLFTLMSGTNEVNLMGGSNSLPGGVAALAPQEFQSALLAVTAFLSIPEQEKQKAATVCGAAWAPSPLQTWTFGAVSSLGGATCSVRTTGSAVYVGYTISAASDGQFSVAVDGKSLGSGTTALAMSSLGGPISLSQQGRTYGPQLIRIAGLTAGGHTVEITITSPTGAGHEVYLDWIGSNTPVSQQSGATVLNGGVLRQGIGSPYTDDITGLFDTQVQIADAALQRDGLNVRFVDVRSSQHGDQINSYLNPDLIHPNDAGHIEIAKVYDASAQAVLNH